MNNKKNPVSALMAHPLSQIILFVIVLTITCINLLVSKKKVHY